MGENKVSYKKKEQSAGVTFDYSFDHELSMLELCNVIKELLKYTLFWRYQIPYPYLSLKAEYDVEIGSRTSDPPLKKRTKTVKLKCTFVENFELILKDLDEILKRDIKQIVVIFGSTVISPKETIVIELDKYSSRCKQLNDIDISMQKAVRRTCQQFLRRIVVGDDFQNVASIRPTKIHVLFSGTRESLDDYASEVFVPKLNFRLNSRGLFHKLNLTVIDDKVVSPENNSSEESNGLITGRYRKNDSSEKNNGPCEVEFYDENGQSDMSFSDDEELDLSPDSKLTSVMQSLQLDSSDEDLVWFMANVQLKGFVEPCSKSSSDSIDWMR